MKYIVGDGLPYLVTALARGIKRISARSGIKYSDCAPRLYRRDRNPVESEEEAGALLSSCPQGAVLVTHTPPFGYCDLRWDGTHEGSLSIRTTIKMRGINLHLCGHIHHSWGTNDTFEGCAIYNLGPVINWFDI